jgi:hypothetical protein
MNWDLYFKHIQTEDDYWKLRNTGMAWELFPAFPESWQEHLIAEKEYDAKSKS